MKKLLVVLLCMATLFMSGCGDKFAKEKEAITKAEKAAMAVQLPVLVKPDEWKQPSPTKKEKAQYQAGLDKLIAAEKRMLAEMKKSDSQIAALLAKAADESEKKDLLAFKDKVHQERINFVKKISQSRLCGDTFIVGVGSTWQEVEMVYGNPVSKGKKLLGSKEYKYEGLKFEDHIGGGVPPLNVLKKWKSRTVQSVFLTDGNITSDAGIMIGMTRDQVNKLLKSKYVNKTNKPERNELKIDRFNKNDESDSISRFAMKDTGPYNMFLDYKNGKLVRYMIAPN
jgi:hypothetical protein